MSGSCRRRKVVASVLRWLVVTFAALVFALPWARQLTGVTALDWFDALLGLQCHRIEGRVAEIGAVSMAVCSRCAGVYLGVLGGAATSWPRLTPRVTVWVVVVAGALMVAELGLEAAGVLPVVHLLRGATGALLSWPVSAFAVRWAEGRIAGAGYSSAPPDRGLIPSGRARRSRRRSVSR